MTGERKRENHTKFNGHFVALAHALLSNQLLFGFSGLWPCYASTTDIYPYLYWFAIKLKKIIGYWILLTNFRDKYIDPNHTFINLGSIADIKQTL